MVSLSNRELPDGWIVVDDQDAVEGAPNVKFDTVDPEGDCRAERTNRVLAFGQVKPSMGEDIGHSLSLTEPSRNYIHVIFVFAQSPLVIGS